MEAILQKYSWEALKYRKRGRRISLANDSDLILNDGSPTRVDDNTDNMSFIDLSGLFNSSSQVSVAHH